MLRPHTDSHQPPPQALRICFLRLDEQLGTSPKREGPWEGERRGAHWK